MPITIFYGDDDYLIQRNIKKVKQEIISPEWEAFNYHQFPPGLDSIKAGIAESLTPPLGNSGRLIILENSSWFGAMSQESLEQLTQYLPQIPETNTLLLTSKKKPDGRLKSTKILTQLATTIKEFNLISIWDHEALRNRVFSVAVYLNLKITPTAVDCLVEAMGNNTRLLFNELEKLGNYTNGKMIEAGDVQALIDNSNANSLELAKAILKQNSSRSWQLLQDLINANEPPLKIVATLTTCFRQWFAVKQLEPLSNQAIAQQLELKNANRVYYLKQEVKPITINQLETILETILSLEIALKSGQNCLTEKILQMTVV
jgi:DNA polymerase III subunit delta